MGSSNRCTFLVDFNSTRLQTSQFSLSGTKRRTLRNSRKVRTGAVVSAPFVSSSECKNYPPHLARLLVDIKLIPAISVESTRRIDIWFCLSEEEAFGGAIDSWGTEFTQSSGERLRSSPQMCILFGCLRVLYEVHVRLQYCLQGLAIVRRFSKFIVGATRGGMIMRNKLSILTRTSSKDALGYFHGFNILTIAVIKLE